MSERGSFCTEYIYCDRCFQAVKEVLVQDGKFLKGVVIPGWEGGAPLPIVAGKMGGLSPGEEIWDFEMHAGQEIAEAICHPVRVAILADDGEEEVFLLQPGGAVERLMNPSKEMGVNEAILHLREAKALLQRSKTVLPTDENGLRLWNEIEDFLNPGPRLCLTCGQAHTKEARCAQDLGKEGTQAK